MVGVGLSIGLGLGVALVLGFFYLFFNVRDRYEQFSLKRYVQLKEDDKE